METGRQTDLTDPRQREVQRIRLRDRDGGKEEREQGRDEGREEAVDPSSHVLFLWGGESSFPALPCLRSMLVMQRLLSTRGSRKERRRSSLGHLVWTF